MFAATSLAMLGGIAWTKVDSDIAGTCSDIAKVDSDVAKVDSDSAGTCSDIAGDGDIAGDVRASLGDPYSGEAMSLAPPAPPTCRGISETSHDITGQRGKSAQN